jgi:hypothetical protein
VVHAGKKYGENMTEIIVDFGLKAGYKVESIIDERKDHTSKHALRQISGLSHDFVVLRGE